MIISLYDGSPRRGPQDHYYTDSTSEVSHWSIAIDQAAVAKSNVFGIRLITDLVTV